MRKYITCLIGILCMAFSGVCFAGRNELMSFRGELISISVIAEDGTEYPIPNASGPITLETKKPIHATVGEGKDLPNGKYVALKYVVRNKFYAKGKVILNDGEYGSVGGELNGPPVFEKDKEPAEFTYSHLKDGEKDTGRDKDENGKETIWCYVTASGGNLEIKEVDKYAQFTLDENVNKTFNLYAGLDFLWFGIEGDINSWDSFNEAAYVKDEGAGGDGFTRLASDRNKIRASFIDPPEIRIRL